MYEEDVPNRLITLSRNPEPRDQRDPDVIARSVQELGATGTSPGVQNPA
jgi:hypothetical protein